MTECEKLRNDLKAFLDGQLSPASRIALRLHLNRCESCRRELEAMRLLGTDLRAADNLEMSDALRSRILASVPTTAPEAKVKMLPKWREKPVMIWGASASAALAWFLLYPAISDYQNHNVPLGQKQGTNQEQSERAAIQYAQNALDQTSSHGATYGTVPSGTPTTDPTTGQRYFAEGHHNVAPTWMTRRALQIQAGNGRASGDASVVRQTELLANGDQDRGLNPAPTGAFRNPTDQASANAGIRNGMPAAPLEKDADGNPYFPYASGLTPLVGDGDGNPVGGSKEHKIFFPQYGIQDSGERSDRRYIPPSNALLEEGVRNNMYIPDLTAHKYAKIETDPSQPGHGVLRYVYPRSVDLADSSDLPTERQVHKEANLTVEVANAEQQSEAVERLVKESKGYVAENQLTTVEDNTRQATLTCKVPVDQFDAVMGQLARLGLLKGKSLSGEDITDKVSDEQETGHVLRADIATTEEKLKERKRHSDIVHDEETLRQLRIRVAQSQARLKMLNKLGALSQITIELDEKPKDAAPAVVKPANPFMEEVSNTGQAAAHTFVMALRLPVQLLVWIVVYSPLWALLYFGYRRLTR